MLRGRAEAFSHPLFEVITFYYFTQPHFHLSHLHEPGCGGLEWENPMTAMVTTHDNYHLVQPPPSTSLLGITRETTSIAMVTIHLCISILKDLDL